MERYLVIWCPDLLEQKEQGREQRAFFRVVEAVSSLATRIETVRLGVCAVPTRGPSRYFGGDLSLCKEVADRVASAVPDTRAGVGAADGLFAAVLAARSASAAPQHDDGPGGVLVVPPGGTPAFLSAWPVGILERVELADLLLRLGIRTLGQFAALPSRHVLARFGTDGAACHLTATGRSGELPGLRAAPGLKDPSTDPQKNAPQVRQPGFWGGTAESDKRAAAVLARLQSDLGPEEVLSARLQGGRDPSERALLLPVDSRAGGTSREGPRQGSGKGPLQGSGKGPLQGEEEPWPGRLPAPSPAVVLARPLPAMVTDAAGAPVSVSARVLLSSPPARVSIAGGPFTEVARWAGPWPADDRWWSPSHRRRARVQVVTASGAAQLLVAEGGGWWLEAVYD
jgi:hypothetical protein